jgi:peptidoglycan hydrolase CwlO-like protein
LVDAGVQSKREQLLDIYIQAKTLKEKIQFLEKMMHSNQVQIKIASARTVEEKQRYSNEDYPALSTLGIHVHSYL